MGSLAVHYRGRRVALASKNGKEAAMALPMRFVLGLELDVYRSPQARHSVNPAAVTPADEALRRAQGAMKASGLPLGLATVVAAVPAGRTELTAACTETMVFIDAQRDFIISETLQPDRPNFSRCRTRSLADLGAWLQAIDFPSHAVVVADGPGGSPAGETIVSLEQLEAALAAATTAAPDGLACVQTDMRAHLNRSRMIGIQRLAFRLARRIAACEGTRPWQPAG